MYVFKKNVFPQSRQHIIVFKLKLKLSSFFNVYIDASKTKFLEIFFHNE